MPHHPPLDPPLDPPPPLPRTVPPRPPRGARRIVSASTTTPVRVAIEATPVVVAGLRALLSEHPAAVSLRRCDDAAQVVIVDIAHQHGPITLPSVDRPVVVMVRDGDIEARRLIRDLGAHPVAASASAQTLVEAVQSAYSRQTRPRSCVDDLARGPGRELTEKLSPREVEVLTSICAGLTNTDIAAELFLSINSVKTYIRSAYRKMGVAGRSQAILWGLDHGYSAGVHASGPAADVELEAASGGSGDAGAGVSS